MTTEIRGRVVWMCRARGFKDHGEYESVKGFEIQKLGHTITAVFDPNAITETGFISWFAEPEEDRPREIRRQICRGTTHWLMIKL